MGQSLTSRSLVLYTAKAATGSLSVTNKGISGSKIESARVVISSARVVICHRQGD